MAANSAIINNLTTNKLAINIQAESNQPTKAPTVASIRNVCKSFDDTLLVRLLFAHNQ